MLEWLVGISTVVTAAATVAYVVYTRMVIEEGKKTRDEQFRPVVLFYAERDFDGEDRDDILLKVANSGTRSAYHINISINNPIAVQNVAGDDMDIRELSGMLRYPIPVLAAGSSMAIRVRQIDERDREKPELIVSRFIAAHTAVVRGSVSYRDSEGREFSDEVAIDVRTLENMRLVVTTRTERHHLVQDQGTGFRFVKEE